MNEKRKVVVHADGVTDDTAALQAIISGEAIGIDIYGRPTKETQMGRCIISEPLRVGPMKEAGP